MLVENPARDYTKGLPVWITDEDIYRERPSLVIGTVDKFARLPWLEDAGNLFSTTDSFLRLNLIIQDELHLISGPLGTMVGLYETAVEMLCQNGGNRTPKIIASTATIRNASSQIRSLYGKDFRQFPQPCIDYADSFFAKEDKKQNQEHILEFMPRVIVIQQLLYVHTVIYFMQLNF